MNTATAQAIDFAHLEEYTAGDDMLAREVLGLFKAQGDSLVAALAAAFDDPKAWKQAAHSIKGASRGIGAWTLAERAAAAELAIAAPTYEKAQLVKAVADAYAAAVAAIDAKLQG
jgi:HPt (histidine-containing phosphotransfer) domain-containing protein